MLTTHQITIDNADDYFGNDVFDLQNIIKKNAMATYITSGASDADTWRAQVKVFQFIMKFCEYESRGMLSGLLGFNIPDDTSMLGSLDIEARKIKWYPQNDKHIEDKVLISQLINEDKITVPLAQVYSNYRYKLSTLANLYLSAYRIFKHCREFLSILENKSAEQMPTFDPKVKLEFKAKIAELTRLKDQTGNEPFTSDWKEKYHFVDQATYLSEAAIKHSSDNLLNINEYSETVLMKKYFFLPYYPGSHLNELATAACFIQETIYYVSKKYLTEDLLKESPQHLSIWKNYISVKSQEGNDGRLGVAVDFDDLRQVRDVGIVNKLVNLDALNKLLTPDVVYAQPYKEIYFIMLLDEVTACCVANNIYLSDNPSPAMDPHLECILSSDFVLAYARLDHITQAGKELAKDASSKQRFYKSIHIEACVLMTFANKNSGNRMAELTGFELEESLIINDPQVLATFSTTFANDTGYFDYVKIESQFRSLKTVKEQLHFLTTIYICAGVLILRLNTPQELVVDKTQYHKLRNKITLTDNTARLITQSPQATANNSTQAMANMTVIMQSARANLWPNTMSEARIKQLICDRYLNLTVKFDDNDLMKAMCFIQAAFNTATHDYFLQVEYAKRRQIIQRRWDKHLIVLPKFSEKIGIEFDATSKQQAGELTKLKEFINLKRLNQFLITHEESLSLAPSAKPSLLRKLFEEIEDYINGEMQKKPYKHLSIHLNAIYKTEFAKTNLRHMAVEELAAKYDRNEDITDLYNDLSIGISKFMEYCDRISGGLLVTITGHDYKISPMTLSRSETEGQLSKLRSDANFYFNLDKFENAFDALTTYRAKLEFLTAQFTEAHNIEKNMLKAQPNRMITSSVMRPNGRPLQTISAMPIINIDANRCRVQINNIVKAYENTADEKPQPRMPKSKKIPNNNAANDEKKAEQPISPQNDKSFLSPIESQLIQFQADFTTARGKFNNTVDLKIGSLQEELQNLDIQLRQTLALDNEERQYNLRPHIKLVKILKREVYLEIDYLVTQIRTAFAAIKPDEQAKLEENIIRLKNIKAQVETLEANREKLLAEIQQESTVLGYIIPKNTLKKAEKDYQEAQRKKERLIRESEEKIRPKKEKVERPRIKPAATPTPLSTAPKKLSPTTKKLESKSSRPDPRAALRLLHLDEACKNLVFIQKILTVHQANISPDVAHFALLYNIFRCFQSLKMYQQKGGSTRSINPDEIINLRNMIIHHGATSAHPAIVAEFAAEIHAKLPKDILKLTHRSLSGFELPQNRRQELMAEFNLLEASVIYNSFLDHSTLVLDDTPLYKKLVAFHEAKVDNNDAAQICESILKTFIPAMKNILPPLLKGISVDSEMKAEHFFDTFYFELQALRMLGSICGEFEAHFKQTHKDKNLQEFLAFCRVSIRNPVAHSDVDFIESLNWFRQLSTTLEKVDVKQILAKPKRTNTTAFFNPRNDSVRTNNAGSAMDVKYDKPPAPVKGLR